MNADLKAAWIAALRSGDYQQTTGILRDKDGFCCLGVACIVGGQELTQNPQNQNELYDWLIEEGIPTLDLWAMNDTRRKTFLEIADYIEENL